MYPIPKKPALSAQQMRAELARIFDDADRSIGRVFSESQRALGVGAWSFYKLVVYRILEWHPACWLMNPGQLPQFIDAIEKEKGYATMTLEWLQHHGTITTLVQWAGWSKPPTVYDVQPREDPILGDAIAAADALHMVYLAMEGETADMVMVAEAAREATAILERMRLRLVEGNIDLLRTAFRTIDGATKGGKARAKKYAPDRESAQQEFIAARQKHPHIPAGKLRNSLWPRSMPGYRARHEWTRHLS